MWSELGLVLLGFALLAGGAKGLVDGGVTLAQRWGVDPWIIGLTVVAWGTSLPEVVVSSLAAWEGTPGAALGNVLGSNVANVGLVLGVTGLILPRVLRGPVTRQEAIVLFGSLAALWLVVGNRTVGRLEGAVLLGAFLVYTVAAFRRPKEYSDETHEELHTVRYPWPAVVLGSVAIALGAKAAMSGAVGLAERFELTDGMVGLVIFAVGTSLPELAAGSVSALRGQAEVGLGNVVGSNVFNTLAVVGIAALVRPFTLDSGLAWEVSVERALGRDLPVTLAFSVALLVAPLVVRGRRGGRRGRERWMPTALLVGYVAYVVSLGVADVGVAAG